MVKKANEAADVPESDEKLKMTVGRVLFLLQATPSIDPKVDMSSTYLEAHAELEAFLHGLCTGFDTIEYCQPRNSPATHFRKLVRNFLAARGVKPATKTPYLYDPVTRVVSFPEYLDTGNCPLIQALTDVRVLLDEEADGKTTGKNDHLDYKRRT